MGALHIDVVADPRPGSRGYFKWYWCYGPGRAKWINSPHPYTALRGHLRKHMAAHVSATAAQWFHDVLGFWPGTPHIGRIPL
jgi:hypothetical protein